jgi:hypothetical protein
VTLLRVICVLIELLDKKRGKSYEQNARTSKMFNENEIRQLEMNQNVENVTEKSITYSATFKLAALKAYKEGQTPMEIFLQAGFDMDVIGRKKQFAQIGSSI